MTFGDFGVTLVGFSFMDLMTTLVGSYFYQIAWNAFHACGLTILPFLIMAFDLLKENYESDEVDDEPHQQVSRGVVNLVITVFVMVLVAAPVLPLENMRIQMLNRTCDRVDIDLDGNGDLTRFIFDMATTGSLQYGRIIGDFIAHNDAMEHQSELSVLKNVSASISMGGETIRVPFWWYFWRQMMLGVGAMMVADLPCDNGLRVLKNELETTFIEDKILANELSEFIAQCTVPAKSMLQSRISGKSYGAELIVPNSPLYLGVDDSGESLYGKIRATKPVWGFGTIAAEKGYDAISASNSSNPSGTPDGYGYPLCSDWWADSRQILSEPLPNIAQEETKRGLEERLLKYFDIINPDECNKFLRFFGYDQGQTCESDNTLTGSQVLYEVLKTKYLGQGTGSIDAIKALSRAISSNAQFGSHNETSDVGSPALREILGLGLDVGLATSAFADFSGNMALLKAMPMATSLLIMIMTAMLPVALIVSRYKVEPVMGLTLLYCSFYLWIPYFRMLRWLDDHLVLMVANKTQGMTQIMLEMMISVGYLGVPLLMGAMFTTAGVRIAQMAPIGGDKMGSIGNSGANMATNAGKTALTRKTKK